ncbi:Olfactory receptor 11A1 [Varanus komodoensis]|uniref:olfactory receptor 6B1-like n=1 Tax=Varanus komodoensis TaxID=61221 RepID=UPI001CF77283|nr:olfactory receptor 6B1-like [Varanus komodoensis]KAF7239667.1 Olfactory receptor 11A1 [Varanus komodoensis]
MKKLEGSNGGNITNFILLSFGDSQELQTLLFMVFLLIYILTMASNLLIVTLVVSDQHLHSPMYFFLGNLSVLETCYSSTILPRKLVSFISKNQSVSMCGCIAQLWVFGFLIASECYLLTAMSYDRYVAICHPLHYSFLMNAKVCLHLVSGSYLSSFLINTVLLIFVLQTRFCGHTVLDHFFCDFISMINVACSDAHQVKLLSAVLASICTLPPFSITIASYGCIINAIIRIPSASGRQKAFSTCSSHLIVVSIFYGILITVYVLPDNHELKELNKLLSVFYTILTPLINPLIYSLRNQVVLDAMKRAAFKCAIGIRGH